jgi:hypothetical protein
MQIKLTLLLLFASIIGQAQEEHEQEIEQLATTDELQLRDPTEVNNNQSVSYNINTVTAEVLASLWILTPQQINDFINHRKEFGRFLSTMELQSIPTWDVFTIKKILPNLHINNENEMKPDWKQRIKEGSHFLLYRTGGNGNGYSNKDGWLVKNKQLLNYKFKFRDLFQLGLMIEKDAGEKNLLDHVGWYALFRNRGLVHDFIVGDFNINMGQGLAHWQGYAFGRSSNILSGYRQDHFIQAHSGTDENRFHRGVGLNLKKGNLEIGAFVGRLKIDANVIQDSVQNKSWISSFLLSGIHRTESELLDKDAVTKLSYGSRIKLNMYKGSIGFNFIQTQFSIPIQKRQLPYNRYAIAGKHARNISIDAGFATKLGFVFGEFALDKELDRALNLGIMKSLDPKMDMSLIYRNMSAKYKALESNCISRNSEAGNETGLLVSFNLHPIPKHSIEGFADIYKNHWPTFTSDRNEYGNLYSLQYNWKPNKKTEFYTRFQIENRTGNQGSEENRTNKIGNTKAHRWRIHFSFSPWEGFQLRCRNEVVKIWKENEGSTIGQLSYLELILKPQAEPLTISFRYTFYETDDYNARIYAYERDLLSYYAIPAHFDVGGRTYLLAQYTYKKAIKLQLKVIGEQKKSKKETTSVSNYVIRNREWRMQILWEFGN